MFLNTKTRTWLLHYLDSRRARLESLAESLGADSERIEEIIEYDALISAQALIHPMLQKNSSTHDSRTEDASTLFENMTDWMASQLLMAAQKRTRPSTLPSA